MLPCICQLWNYYPEVREKTEPKKEAEKVRLFVRTGPNSGCSDLLLMSSSGYLIFLTPSP